MGSRTCHSVAAAPHYFKIVSFVYVSLVSPISRLSVITDPLRLSAAGKCTYNMATWLVNDCAWNQVAFTFRARRNLNETATAAVKLWSPITQLLSVSNVLLQPKWRRDRWMAVAVGMKKRPKVRWLFVINKKEWRK